MFLSWWLMEWVCRQLWTMCPRTWSFCTIRTWTRSKRPWPSIPPTGVVSSLSACAYKDTPPNWTTGSSSIRHSFIVNPTSFRVSTVYWGVGFWANYGQMTTDQEEEASFGLHGPTSTRRFGWVASLCPSAEIESSASP